MEKKANEITVKNGVFDISDDEVEVEVEVEVVEEEGQVVNKIISSTPVSVPMVAKTSSEDVSSVHIPKETIERLLKDIKDIFMSSLEKEGIYYKHSDTNILKAYVMIVGQPDTLYFGGYYFFQINIPADYPHSPPVLEYLTNDGITRFHPNFYKSKRVCLSMLNTWRGEQWTSCLTIKSVLLTILSIMDNRPMLHEPGVTEKHQDYNNYHNMISYKNIDFSCIRLINEFMSTTIIPFEMEYKEYFYKFMLELFKKNAEKLKQVIDNAIKLKNYNRHYTISGLYNMSFYVNYDELLDKLKKTAKTHLIILE
jgi:ubiquitin-conjugating enzyme E2 Z